ncbi:Alpha-tubulin folding cofactor B domain-containing protein [Dioscorea alata]|uniref:Alpha-tubulin folding cofactor B domain-containing protein n=1 Tax=Dioscorea alata TaxID=55571 RepID=A0ACB7UER5_DIOAL|nr:Alpha-tubulin folding cofactor B domain-containing protein [Dioscorea alata]
MASALQLPVDDSILFQVTHANIKSFSIELCLSLQTTIESVKEKLWRKCGTSVASMLLQLFDDSGSKICDLTDDFGPLGFFSPHDGYRLHIVDFDPSSVTSGGWLEDTSLAEKCTISEEAYDKLGNNFRKFKEKMASQHATGTHNKLLDKYMEDLCADIKVGDRCQIEPGEKRGVVKFVGKAETARPG